MKEVILSISLTGRGPFLYQILPIFEKLQLDVTKSQLGTVAGEWIIAAKFPSTEILNAVISKIKKIDRVKQVRQIDSALPLSWEFCKREK